MTPSHMARGRLWKWLCALLLLALFTQFISANGQNDPSLLDLNQDEPIYVRRHRPVSSLSPWRKPSLGGRGAPRQLVPKQFTVQVSDAYNAAVRKGRGFLCKFRMSHDFDTTLQSRFLQYADLRRWGWARGNPDPSPFGPDILDEDGFYDEEGVDIDDQQVWYHKHRLNWADNNGVPQAPTQGDFCQVFFPADGVLIFENNHSPKFMNKEGPWPDLQLHSDGSALQWIEACNRAGESPSHIRQIIRSLVAYPPSRVVLEEVMGEKGKNTLPPFNERITFSLAWDDQGMSQADDDTLAVLGTPHGAGVAYFLLQHKSLFGVKRISEIQMWSGGNSGAQPLENAEWMMRFIIEDVPADQVQNPE